MLPTKKSGVFVLPSFLTLVPKVVHKQKSGLSFLSHAHITYLREALQPLGGGNGTSLPVFQSMIPFFVGLHVPFHVVAWSVE
jgi:hypothetical protein